ncbi:hypothetical protein F2P79_022271, partial [Pimephales promelas]
RSFSPYVAIQLPGPISSTGSIIVSSALPHCYLCTAPRLHLRCPDHQLSMRLNPRLHLGPPGPCLHLGPSAHRLHPGSAVPRLRHDPSALGLLRAPSALQLSLRELSLRIRHGLPESYRQVSFQGWSKTLLDFGSPGRMLATPGLGAARHPKVHGGETLHWASPSLQLPYCPHSLNRRPGQPSPRLFFSPMSQQLHLRLPGPGCRPGPLASLLLQFFPHSLVPLGLPRHSAEAPPWHVPPLAAPSCRSSPTSPHPIAAFPPQELSPGTRNSLCLYRRNQGLNEVAGKNLLPRKSLLARWYFF